jgi:hypothetical protein
MMTEKGSPPACKSRATTNKVQKYRQYTSKNIAARQVSCLSFHPCHTPKERFLSGAHRPSTLAIGEALWSRLKDGSAIVNVSQVARETGYSRPTVYRALSFYAKFMKAFPVAVYSVGNSPGRPRLYDINPAYRPKQQEQAISSKRVNLSYRLQEKLNDVRRKFYDASRFSLKKPLMDPEKTTEGKKRFQPSYQKSKIAQLSKKLNALTDSKRPTQRDKRLLMAAVRKLFNAPKPVQDGICSQIARQRNRTNADWKAILRLMWKGCQLVPWDDPEREDPEREAPGGGLWQRYLADELPDRSDHRAYFSYWARVVRYSLRGFGNSRLDDIDSLESAMILALKRETTVEEDYRFYAYRLQRLGEWAREEGAEPYEFDTFENLKPTYDELECAMEEGLGDVLAWKIMR